MGKIMNTEKTCKVNSSGIEFITTKLNELHKDGKAITANQSELIKWVDMVESAVVEETGGFLGIYSEDSVSGKIEVINIPFHMLESWDWTFLISQSMIDAAKKIDASASESAIRKILELGLPYRSSSADDVSRTIKGFPPEIIDGMLEAAIATMQ